MLPTTTDLPPVLAALGILRDSLDDICKTWDQTFAILEKHNQKMEPFNDKLSEQDVSEDILTILPPEKASALVAALTDAAEFAKAFPLEDATKQLNMTKEAVTSLQNIRDNLHKALDGVVP